MLVLSIAATTAAAEDFNASITDRREVNREKADLPHGLNGVAKAPSVVNETNSLAAGHASLGLLPVDEKRRNKPKKNKSDLPTLQPWETFWIDHQVELAESRAQAQLVSPGVKDVVVVVPNDLKESQAPVILPYSAEGIRELNVVVVAERSTRPVVVDGPYSGAVIGAVVQPNDPRRVSRILGRTNLLAGTVVVQGSRAPEQVNMITKIDRIEARPSSTFRRKPVQPLNRNRP